MKLSEQRFSSSPYSQFYSAPPIYCGNFYHEVAEGGADECA
ncbi:Uncharacterised protein [Yersinia similis]|uniref:Uncharacterized protein n=1 Tax=Yersinia similis TaxID=367190 RepID=A0A0T9PS67_9GAMM|nr:Uncharacterised protein [Yersinia similis]